LPAINGTLILKLSTVTRRKLLRLLATTFVLISLALLLVGCDDRGDSSGNGDNGGVIITPLETPEAVAPDPEADPTEDAPDNGPAPASTASASALTGFSFPIVGGCLPTGDQLMPNAPRTYRDGTHEGVDFYDSDNCTSIGLGTPVVAAKAGVVIRADLDYVDLTPARYAEIAADIDSAEALDAFRGRQVWIDHGDGVVTRYCHLSDIAQGIAVGASVDAGDLVAFVGESGTPESINNPGNQYHLHFELRVGDSYLGAGLPAFEVRALYRELFGQ
jgi:murein DD-endopeptidase MepM/ murein hydrolase activator NlpD